jgi:hypothetical protein
VPQRAESDLVLTHPLKPLRAILDRTTTARQRPRNSLDGDF